MKLQVRVKGILQAIANKCNSVDFPEPLVKFLSHLTDNDTFMPHNFLTQFEMSRLKLDDYGSLSGMNPNRENMVI